MTRDPRTRSYVSCQTAGIRMSGRNRDRRRAPRHSRLVPEVIVLDLGLPDIERS